MKVFLFVLYNRQLLVRGAQDFGERNQFCINEARKKGSIPGTPMENPQMQHVMLELHVRMNIRSQHRQPIVSIMWTSPHPKRLLLRLTISQAPMVSSTLPNKSGAKTDHIYSSSPSHCPCSSPRIFPSLGYVSLCTI